MKDFCVYLTIYRGNRLPPFYIGSSSVSLIENGYRGSVRSKEYAKVWKRELRDNPQLFETRIVKRLATRQQAHDAEQDFQLRLSAVTNPLYANKSLARDFRSLRKGAKLTQEQRKRIASGLMGHQSHERQVEAVTKRSAREWVVTRPDGSEVEVYNLSAFARENGGLNVANMINVSSKGYRARLKDPTNPGVAKGHAKSNAWKRDTGRRTQKRWEVRRVSVAEYDFKTFLETFGMTPNIEFTLDEGSLARNVARTSWDDARLRGVDQYRVHSHEWANKREIVESMIRSRIGKSGRRLMARKLELRTISSTLAKKFHEKNHVGGAGNPSVAYALCLGKKVMSVMSFARSRYEGYEWELNRFSHARDTSVAGAAGRLFKAFVKDVSPRSVVSFADLRWGSGRVYEKIGFSLVKLGPPTYWYFRDDRPNRMSRMAFQKAKLASKLENFDPDLTEAENMRQHGYHQYWDCGSAEYSWKAVRA